MRSLLLHWLFNAAALWIAAHFVPGLAFTGTVLQLLFVAAVFGAANSVLRPILTVLTCPLIVLTLGLFMFVINAMMLLFTGWISEQWDLGFSVSGFGPAVWGGLVVAFASLVLALVVQKD